jgi:hypothetical protein
MALIRGHLPFEDDFTQIPNAWLRDNRLSLGSIGLLAQLLSHRPGWKITQENLAKANNVGRDAVRTMINELVSSGYLKKSEKRQRNSAGQLAGYDYVTCDPMLDEPTLAEPTLGEPTQADPTHKNIISKNTISKKTKERVRSLPDDWKPKETLFLDDRYSVLDIDSEAESFRNWCLAYGKKYADWDAAFRNWLKKGLDFQAKRNYKEVERDRARQEMDAWLRKMEDSDDSE